MMTAAPAAAAPLTDEEHRLLDTMRQRQRDGLCPTPDCRRPTYKLGEFCMNCRADIGCRGDWTGATRDILPILSKLGAAQAAPPMSV